MKTRKFLVAYRQPRHAAPVQFPDIPPDTTYDHDIALAGQYAELWGWLLYDLLSGAKLPDEERYKRFVDDYYAEWANRLREYLQTAVLNFQIAHGQWRHEREQSDEPVAVPEELDVMMQEITEFLHVARYHLLQRFSQTPWMIALSFVPHDKFKDGWLERHVARQRARMGLDAALIALLREGVNDLEAAGSEAAAALRQAVNGALAELDAGVALWGLTGRVGHDGVVVLPAPPSFERGAGPANADFLVIDRRRGRIMGVQVKSTARSGAIVPHDRERIMLLHAAEDLDGMHVLSETDVRRGHRVPRPGALTLRYLFTTRLQEVQSKELSQSDFDWAREKAREAMPDIESESARRAREIAEASIGAPQARRDSASAYQARVRAEKQAMRARADRTADRVIDRIMSALGR